MNNMTIRLRMLACIIATAITSLAFLAPCAALAAQPKVSIMGTPAQLVEDFMSAGYDLQKMVYYHQGELPSRFTRRKDSSGYMNPNTVLAQFKYSGRLRFIHINSPRFSKFLTGESIGAFRQVFRMSPDEVIQRYGSEYASHTKLTGVAATHVHDIVGFTLLVEPQNALWAVALTWDRHDELVTIGCKLYEYKIGRVNIDAPDMNTAEGRIYSDLEDMGLALKKPFKHPELLQRAGYWLNDDVAYSEVNKRRFNNGHITLVKASNEVVGYWLELPVAGGKADDRMKNDPNVKDLPVISLEALADMRDSDLKSRDIRYGFNVKPEYRNRPYSFILEREGELYPGSVCFSLERTESNVIDGVSVNANVMLKPVYRLNRAN